MNIETWAEIAGLILTAAVGLATGYFASRRSDDDDDEPRQHVPQLGRDQLNLLGHVLGETAGLTQIRDELREIRGVMQSHLDTDKTEELVDAVKEVTAAVKAKARTQR